MLLTESVIAARRVSAPILIIRTPDPADTQNSITDAVTKWHAARQQPEPAYLRWDSARGLAGINAAGKQAFQALGKSVEETINPVECLVALENGMPDDGILFWSNFHRLSDEPVPVQAVWNLRDSWKKRAKMFIGLCPSITLPGELTQDALVLDEALPEAEDIITIANTAYKSAGLEVPPADVAGKIVDACLGLAAFPTEQAICMSMRKSGVNVPELWERKRKLIEQSPGLSVWRGNERFSDVGGCENLKKFLRAVIFGELPPRGVVFIDEIEKALGTGQDTSGVSQGILGQLLTRMQDTDATGVILIGAPGTAKSAIAKALGNEAGVPTIALDLGGFKASLVGESESRCRNALNVVDAVTQKRALYIATCNSIGILPPELRRRFTFGTFFCSLPDKAERAAIWKLYQAKFELDQQPLPLDAQWTGAEIRQCCTLAWRLKKPLVECAAYIVPVAISAADQIQRLYQQADGRFISASHPGLFKMAETNEPTNPAPSGRRMDLN